jgi:threonine/homoserine/homoserine lactone efflux protein
MLSPLQERCDVTLETYLLYIGAIIVLVLVPGPDMIYLLTRSVAQGRRAGMVAALGINAGGYVHLLAAVTGLSAILLTSVLAFTIIKWIGAAYLVYLGLGALFGRSGAMSNPTQTEGLVGLSLTAVFWQGFLSDVLNPKVAIFFLALLPQFVNVQAGHVAGQLLLLGVTGNLVAIAINLVLVALAAQVSQSLRRSPRIVYWLQKAMGTIFVALGVRLATERA